jgi:soluble lytic murein transglycosylase
MMRLIFLFALVVIGAYAKYFDFDYVHQMPTSREKDYYIWRYLLQDDTNQTQAIEITKGAFALNSKMIEAFRKKTGFNPTLTHKPLPKPTQAQKEAWRRKAQISKEVKKAPHPMQEFLKKEADMQTFIFNNATKVERKKFNHILTPNQYQKLTHSTQFNRSIELIEQEGLEYLQKSFLFAPALANALTYDTNIKLALNALRNDKPDIALLYFGEARKKAEESVSKDLTSFWLYLISKDEIYLNALIESKDINIYTLLARDRLRLHYPDTINPTFSKQRNPNFDITDPIAWAKLKTKIFDISVDNHKLAQNFETTQTIAHYSYIKAKAYDYQKHYFPLLYRDLMRHLPVARQALIYAIARQESRFVPASVSSSFALGMMQIMPFLVEDIAKKRGDSIDLDDMFNPQKALVYANFHLDYLQSWLFNPLLVAYAYNGGIGFTKGLLTHKNLFNNAKYEPFLSMESIEVKETREYGKAVLANYVIYLNKLGHPMRISQILKHLKDANKVDRFR